MRVPLTFITGPVRSGKSRFAERLAHEAGGAVTYVATGRIDPHDAEWTARIAHHTARRPAAWGLVETARPGDGDLATLVRAAGPERTLLVDSFGTWLAERITHRFEAAGDAWTLDAAGLEAEANDAADAFLVSRAATLVVGEEVGWGLVPDYPAGRIFRDVLGRVHQRLAAGASRAYLVVAGFALDLHACARAIDDA